MPRTIIRYDDYKVKAFLDTNIILECRPLPELPWDEIDHQGPIIALLTPTAIKEVDSKKQDGRIGKRARAFNKLIASVAAGGAPITIRDSAPRVDLALARCARIPWNQHDDLDADDGDSCIVAEILHARDMSDAGKLLVSQDIKPISFAASYDLQTLHVSENWLRQMEPSPADKEIQRLKSRLAEYEANEPVLGVRIELPDGEPVSLVRVEELSDADRTRIEYKISQDNPKENQTRSPYGLMSSLGLFDQTYDRRYAAYSERISSFVATYELRLERFLNQKRFKLTVSNIGKVQAENLLVEVRVTSGWLHDRYIWSSPGGPRVPKPHIDQTFRISKLVNNMPTIPRRVGRHELSYKDKPHWRSWFSVTCEDFRHGQDWVFEGIIGLDPRMPDTQVIVDVTASNLRGKVHEVKQIESREETVHLATLIDLDSLKFITKTPVDDIARHNDRSAIDWKAFPVDDNNEEENEDSD